MSDTFKINGDAVRELAQILDATGLTEIEYVVDNSHIRVARQIQAVAASHVAAPAAVAPAAPAAAQESASAPQQDLKNHPGALKSPMVGTAYSAPEPGAPAFVKVGDKVNAGQVVLIIEAMKVMNPIKATTAGTVTQILVNDGTPVEFDEALLIIE